MGDVARLKRRLKRYAMVAPGGEITLRIFPKLKRHVNTGQACFEIAQHGIDPLEMGAGLARPFGRPQALRHYVQDVPSFR